jgi:RNase P protein component
MHKKMFSASCCRAVVPGDGCCLDRTSKPTDVSEPSVKSHWKHCRFNGLKAFAAHANLLPQHTQGIVDEVWQKTLCAAFVSTKLRCCASPTLGLSVPRASSRNLQQRDSARRLCVEVMRAPANAAPQAATVAGDRYVIRHDIAHHVVDSHRLHRPTLTTG